MTKDWTAYKEKDTMFEVFQREGVKNQNYQLFIDNPPAWNPSKLLSLYTLETATYVYDFKGRVSKPSIKNFQLIPELDGRKKQTLADFVL